MFFDHISIPRMKSVNQNKHWPDQPYPRHALAQQTIPEDRYWPDRTDFGHPWPDQTDFDHYWPDRTGFLQNIDRTERNHGKTEQSHGQAVVQTMFKTEQTLCRPLSSPSVRPLSIPLARPNQLLCRPLCRPSVGQF